LTWQLHCHVNAVLEDGNYLDQNMAYNFEALHT
jgi:hypothetical protein